MSSQRYEKDIYYNFFIKFKYNASIRKKISILYCYIMILIWTSNVDINFERWFGTFLKCEGLESFYSLFRV